MIFASVKFSTLHCGSENRVHAMDNTCGILEGTIEWINLLRFQTLK